MKKKKMKLVVFAIFLALTFLPNTCVIASAPNTDTYEVPIVLPRYTAIMTCAHSFEVNSAGRLSCYSDTNARPGYIAGVTMELQKSTGTNSWTTIKTWTDERNEFAYLSANYYVTSGTYRLKLSHTSKTSGGSLIETVTKYSSSIIYN